MSTAAEPPPDAAARFPKWRSVALVLAGLVALRTVISDWRLAANGEVGPNGDISVYIGAINYLKSGGAIYNYPPGGGYGFTYPPFAAIVLRPLTWLSPTATGLIWLTWCIGVAVSIVAVIVVTRRAHRRSVDLVIIFLLGVIAFLGSAQVQSDLITGQVNLVLALAILLDLGRFLPDRWRGVLVGIAAAVKLTPMVVWGWFVLTRQWRALANSVGAFALCALLGWIVLPDESRQFWAHTILETDRVGDVELRFNATVMGTLARAGLDGTVRTALWLLIGGLVVLAAYFRAVQARRHGDDVAAAIVLGCAAVIASPIAWPHHQIWLPLAGVVLLLRERRVPRIAGATLVLFAFFHIPLTRLWDAHGLGWLFNNVDFAMFVGVCVLGLAASAAEQPSPRSPWARRSPSGP